MILLKCSRAVSHRSEQRRQKFGSFAVQKVSSKKGLEFFAATQ
jgi:hypothetical protein